MDESDPSSEEACRPSDESQGRGLMGVEGRVEERLDDGEGEDR